MYIFLSLLFFVFKIKFEILADELSWEGQYVHILSFEFLGLMAVAARHKEWVYSTRVK